MELVGQRNIDATQSQIWQALNNPDILKQAIPGCERFESSGTDEYSVTVALKIGPVSAKFSGKVTLQDIIAPQSYSLNFEAQGGMAGFGKGQAKVQLTPRESGGCELSYSVHSQVGGKIAQLGQRLIEGVAKSLSEDFFKRFENALIAELGTHIEPEASQSETELESNPFAKKALYGIGFAVALLLLYFWMSAK